MDSVRASVQGTSEAHQVVARLRSEPLGMEVQASGGISERRWSGTLDRLDIGESPLGSWRLGEATTAAAGTERAMLGLACWVSGEARICLEGSWEAGGTTSGRFSVSGFPGSAVVELMPEGWALDGVLKVFWYDDPATGVVAGAIDLLPQLAVLATLTVVFLWLARRLAGRWESA